jgi:hypothetical protein
MSKARDSKLITTMPPTSPEYECTQFDADISGGKLKKIPHILTYKKKRLSTRS